MNAAPDEVVSRSAMAERPDQPICNVDLPVNR